MEEAVAEELAKFDGVSAAVSSIALRTASLPDTRLMRAILKNFHPKRSGDIFVVFEPNVFISDFDGLEVARVLPLLGRRCLESPLKLRVKTSPFVIR